MAGLIPIGAIEAAGDVTTGAVIDTPGSKSQKAVDARIQGVAADIIAADPTVADAAAAAVTADIEGRDLVEGSDPRVPRYSDIADYSAVVHDADGGLTWLNALASDGGPDDFSVSMLGSRTGVQKMRSVPGVTYSVHDPNGVPTHLTLDADGSLAGWVLDELAPKIGTRLGATGGGLRLADFPIFSAALAGIVTTSTPAQMVFCGDSFTAHLGSGPNAGYVRLVMENIQGRFPNLTGTETELQGSSTGVFPIIHTTAGVHAYSAGTGGSTSATSLPDAKCDQIANDVNPDWISISLGVNDFRDQIPPSTYRDNIIDRFNYFDSVMTKPYQKVLIFQSERLDMISPTYTWGMYRDAMREVADATGARMIDTSLAFAGAHVPGDDALGLIEPDQVHPTGKGYRFMSMPIIQALS